MVLVIAKVSLAMLIFLTKQIFIISFSCLDAFNLLSNNLILIIFRFGGLQSLSPPTVKVFVLIASQKMLKPIISFPIWHPSCFFLCSVQMFIFGMEGPYLLP